MPGPLRRDLCTPLARILQVSPADRQGCISIPPGPVYHYVHRGEADKVDNKQIYIPLASQGVCPGMTQVTIHKSGIPGKDQNGPREIQSAFSSYYAL
jgi:hypothetical protein